MGNLFITSDQHFFHENILKYQKKERDFDTVYEMNDAIIERHNEVVKPNDEIWYLGDFAFSKEKDALDMLSKLNGKKNFIFGNHDKIMYKNSIRENFNWMGDYKEIKVGKRSVILCHYPIFSWNKMAYGSVHLYGHTHNQIPHMYHGLSMDIGVDGNNLYPHAVEDVIHYLKNSEKFEEIDVRGRNR